VTRRIACIVAHPDDDTYGVGGSLALHAGSDLEVTVVVTTSGEAGQIADPSLATRQTLASVREAEGRASWEALGIEPTIHFLRYPDSRVADVPREELTAAYVELLLEARPEVVVTFGPDGVTGHADHVAVGSAATDAFHAARAQTPGCLHRLLYTVLSRARLEAFNVELVARGMEPMDPTQPYTPRGVPDERIGVSVDCSPAFGRKLEALRRHRTQGEMEDLPFELWPAVLGREEFVLAWPERPAGVDDPLLGDVFEGLPGA
jgi:LmbE family N-acetylglucosaminyl deacetylase